MNIHRHSPSAPLREKALVFLVLLPLCSPAQQPTNYARDLVNPFIGTGGHGHTFPGACVPNGLVQLSPDTRPDGVMDWDGCGGYHYSDSVIYGFSHTHLSGTGVADLCDVLLMPMSGKASTDPAVYRSAFQHKTEAAHAGYYRVWLEDEKTLAELTTTAHCGVHRYTMPADQEQFLVLDLNHRDKLLGSSLRQEGSEIVGERRSSSWARDQRLFFCMRIGRSGGSVGISLQPKGDSTKAVVNVQRADASAIIVKVGISAVSIEGARANLDAEVPGWDFDAVRKQAEDAWNAKLGKIQIEGGTKEQQRIFHTALYHSYVAPYIFNDVDGNYRGMDGKVHHADHNVYTVFSLWDTFRALHPLMTILEPEMTNDFIKTFLLHYQQGGRLPVWELWGNETDCMIGYHSASVIADAYMKGIRGFDEKLAMEALLASAMRDEPGLNAYRKQGYISSEDASESVSKTVEYAYDDWCIAMMAREQLYKLPREQQNDPKNGELYRTFLERAQSWRNLLDPSTGFFRPRRNADMLSPFDPYEVNFNFTEANAWQYSQFAPHAFKTLSEKRVAMGIAPRSMLDSLFTTRTATTGRQQADITGLIGQYAHGNEPSHHMAYLYAMLGRPERTRELVRSILSEQYHDSPDGLSGNEDCGQMSAWYVMSALGIYPIAPGDPTYTLGYPLFDEARIDVGKGRTFTVHVSDSTWAQIEGAKPQDTDDDTPPVMDDGSGIRYQSTPPLQIAHAELVHGGELRFDRNRVAKPATTVSISSDDPPSVLLPIAPIISAGSPVFRDSLAVNIVSDGAALVVIRTEKDTTAFIYKGTFHINGSCSVEATSAGSAPSIAQFHKIDGDRTIELGSTYANEYSAGGDQALIDGLRGGKDFRTGEWQGYRDQDVLITVDLGTVKTLKRAGLSVFQDQGSWIWYPEYVDVAWSMNGRQWSSTVLVPNVDRKADGGMTKELWTGVMTKKARYIKIMAKNAGPCPDWHPGKGGTTWIFADEVLIEAE